MSQKNQAVQAALKQDWTKAIAINLEILDKTANDIPTLNRLAFAYMRMGKIAASKKIYKQVLSLDKHNPIAQKSIQKLATIKPGTKIKKITTNQKIVTSFIEEPGKTRTVSLVRPAPVKTLIHVTVGMPVVFLTKKRRISIETEDGDYIGCLPDDIGLRLMKLMAVGYKYQCHIKSNHESTVVVFIRETHRTNKEHQTPSFPGNTIISVTEDLTGAALENIPIDVTPTGEDE